MSSVGVAQVKFGSSAAKHPLDALQIVPTQKPHAGHGQIVVRITVRPIHHCDLNAIRNSRFSSLASQGRRIIIGDEGCGVVEEVSLCLFGF
jgi:NADPH:quinone reductase-like Zn-dependent oxidoreductase